MPKTLSLIFATLSIVFLSLMSIAIAHSLKWVFIWGGLSILTIGVGFVIRKKYNRKM